MSENAAEMMTQMPAESHGPVASVVSKAELPAFTVQAKDCWGNRTGPTEDLLARVLLECEALDPRKSWYTLGDDGTATVQGGTPRMLDNASRLLAAPTCTPGVQL